MQNLGYVTRILAFACNIVKPQEIISCRAEASLGALAF